MKRHFNTPLERLDLQFRHDLIESRGKLVSLKKDEYLCRKGEPINAFSYLSSKYICIKNRILTLLSYQKCICSFLKVLSIIGFVCIHCACSNTNAEKQLSEAEALIIQHPDSAVSLLVQMDTTHMSKKQIARTRVVVFIYAAYLWKPGTH